MKIDLNEEIKITKWNLLQLILICLAIGAGGTLLNPTLGLVFIGITILFFALPILIKLFGAKDGQSS